MKSSTRILVIEDETAIQRFLRVSLESEGYAVHIASSGLEGLREAIAVRPELVILDLGLPDQDGIQVLRQLREWSKVPVIVVTVRDSEKEKVTLLDAGADDYVTKPFSVQELLARVRASLRHVQETSSGPVFRSGSLEVHLAEHTVKMDGQIIHLTTTEYDLLKLLVKNAGKVLTQRQLLREVWGPHAVEHSHYLRIYVGQLRKKLNLESSSLPMIVTEPGVGYRFVGAE